MGFLVTPYEEAQLKGLKNLQQTGNFSTTEWQSRCHGAWNAVVDGKGLSELTFDFLTDRQNLIVE